MAVDLVRLALERPIDWEQFERLVVEILAQDDLPRLRKLGGRGDFGIDAVDEVFFVAESRVSSVVQITSQKAQVEKFVATVKRLRETGNDIKQLIMVYRHPVESTVRTELQEKALALALTVDVRDGEYLVRHLGNASNGIFARYYGTMHQQIDQLLNVADPLAIAPDRVYRAMLASLGAYVAHPRARIARRTLFEKATLAALVAEGDQDTSFRQLAAKLSELFPDEQLNEQQIRSAVTDLKKEKLCAASDDSARPSVEALSEVGLALTKSRSAFDLLHMHVLRRVEEKGRLDDASKGFLERNLRKALVRLFREIGPLRVADIGHLGAAYDQGGIVATLCESLGECIGRRAALALHEYTLDPSHAASLGPLVRSYAALAIRNIDPMGRRWQKTALGRSLLVLDTDAVLITLVDELPECFALRSAVRTFVDDGVHVVIPEAVLGEAIDHISRAPRTMRKFQHRLHRLSPDAADETIWHAIVLGYYYSGVAGKRPSWEDYFAKYYDATSPRKYVEFLLRKRITFDVRDLPVEDNDHSDIETIVASQMAFEDKRLKAPFREHEDRSARVQKDVRIAIATARLQKQDRWESGSGYVVSEDVAFRRFEQHRAWRDRPRIHVFRRAIPHMAGMICGKGPDDSTLVRLLFNPIASAAAELMEDEIELLSSAGVDLSSKSVDRLEWELRDKMQTAIHSSPEIEIDDPATEEILTVIRTAELAQANGYPLDERLKNVVDHYDDIVSTLRAERDRRTEAEVAREQVEMEKESIAIQRREQLTKIAKAAIGQTKRGRARVRRALKHLGLNLDELLAPNEQDDNSSDSSER